MMDKLPAHSIPTSSIKHKKEPTVQPKETTKARITDQNQDEFELYAIAVEKSIKTERALTEMRLCYINKLRPATNQEGSAPVDMVNLTLLKSEDTINSDSSIMLSAIQDGNLDLIKQFLTELKPRERKKLLESKVCAKYGMSFLQIALEHDNYGIFRELRISMDKNTKRKLAKSTDDFGNNLLHNACLANTLFSIQKVLANFSEDERQHLISSTNNRGDNCLKMAVANPYTEVFLFLLRQFHCDKLLWESIRAVSQSGITLAHSIVCRSTRGSNKMLEELLNIAKRLNKVQEFLFQYGCSTTLLHYLVTASMLDYEEEGNVLTNLTLLLTMAGEAKCKDELLLARQEEDERYSLRPTALYRLASIKEHNQTRVCDLFLRQFNLKGRVDYIMAKELTTGQNALHAAARADNVEVLQCLLRHIPSSAQMRCLMTGSKDGHTPLHIAAGDNASIQSFKEILKHLSQEERKRLVLSEESHGNTPILIAFTEGNITLVNMLMKEEWVPRRMIFPLMSARNNVGWTIIHLSCIRLVGDTLTDSVLRFLSDFPGVNLKAMISHIDFNGNTVLHLAALLYRSGVVASVMRYLPRSEHKRLLTKKNKDGLVASQLCNMPDLVVVKYLQPLKTIGWSDAALFAKRDSGIYKLDTQRRFKHFEEQHQIKTAPIEGDVHDDEVDLDDWEFHFEDL